MSASGLRNPIGRATAEYYIYLDTPESAARIAALEKALEYAKSKPAEVKEIVREVFKDDPSLLARYNAAMRELGALKTDLSNNSEASQAQRALRMMAEEGRKPKPPLEIVKEQPLAPIIHIRRVLDKRLLALAIGAALAVGSIGGVIIGKSVAEPQKIEVPKSAPSGGVPRGGVK